MAGRSESLLKGDCATGGKADATRSVAQDIAAADRRSCRVGRRVPKAGARSPLGGIEACTHRTERYVRFSGRRRADGTGRGLASAARNGRHAGAERAGRLPCGRTLVAALPGTGPSGRKCPSPGAAETLRVHGRPHRHPNSAMTRTCWRRCTASSSRNCPRGTHAFRPPQTPADAARQWPHWHGRAGRKFRPALRMNAPMCCSSTSRVTARCRPSRGKPARSWEPPIALICRASGQPVVELPSSGLDPECQADFSF